MGAQKPRFGAYSPGASPDHRASTRIHTMKLKTFFASAAGLGAVSLAGAVAAQPAMNWNGPYVGVLAGAQFGKANFALPGDANDVLQSNSASNTAFTWGGMVGFNVTTGGVVLGIEGDLMDANNK